MGDTNGHRAATATHDSERPLPGRSSELPFRSMPKKEQATGHGQPGQPNFSKPIPITLSDPSARVMGGPVSPMRINNPYQFAEPSSAQIETYLPDSDLSRTSSADHSYLKHGNSDIYTASPERPPQAVFRKPRLISNSSVDGQLPSAPTPWTGQRSESPKIITTGPDENPQGEYGRSGLGRSNIDDGSQPAELSPSFQYHHQQLSSEGNRRRSTADHGHQPQVDSRRHTPSNDFLDAPNSRPTSSYSATAEGARQGREDSPSLSPNHNVRSSSSQGRRSPDTRSMARPFSYVDLLALPYNQQTPPNVTMNHSHLKGAVGSNAALLSSKKTLEMYRANVKKTADPAVLYTFAIFMLEAAQEALRKPATGPGNPLNGAADAGAAEEQGATDPAELIAEARQILQRLADKSYPFAQYYLADGLASGFFNKGKEDNDKAFPLFISASKHGHAEAGYRAALCYEFGWGTRKDPMKCVQYYRQAAAKNHPGAMTRLGRACLTEDLGLANRYREGLKWLKRAAEAADQQYNSAPFELGLLHETGYGDDVFRDQTYAAQLFTQSADLGHLEANFRLGDAYEHGTLNCPRDPALSVHFYNGAAQRGHPVAMMALCAWYMVGAGSVLEKDENEAYEWAKRSAECGLPKAEYAVGYFTEMGIGCRRDPLEANVWYVRAADQGDERARLRIKAIHAAASGDRHKPSASASAGNGKASKEPNKVRKSPGGEHGAEEKGEKEKEKEKGKGKKWGIF